MNKHLDALKRYLPTVIIIELSLAMAVHGSITFCLTIAKVVKEYKSTIENEDFVTKHLEALCRIHFKKLKKEKGII